MGNAGYTEDEPTSKSIVGKCVVIKNNSDIPVNVYDNNGLLTIQIGEPKTEKIINMGHM